MRMWLRLTLLNIREFFRTKPLLLVFIILSQIICIIAAFTVAGMIDAVTRPAEAKDGRSEWEKSFEIDFSLYEGEDQFLATYIDTENNQVVYRGTDQSIIKKYEEYDFSQPGRYSGELTALPSNFDKLPKYGDIREKINRILSSAGRHYVEMVMTGYTSGDDMISFYAEGGPKEFEKRCYPELLDGGIKLYLGKPAHILSVNKGDKLKLGNTEYTVNSVVSKSTKGDMEPLCWLLPEYADDSFIITYFRIQVDDALAGDELGAVSDKIKNEFAGITANIKDPVPKPLMEKQFNNMIYVVSFILMAVMMLNLSRLYTFILAKRKNTLAVYSVCGGSKAKIFVIYIIEILLTLGFSYLCGFILFRFVIMGMIGKVYPSFLTFFEPNICIMILGAYIIFGGIVMGLSIVPVIRKTVTSLRREGGI